MKRLKMKELEKATGTSRETIRYYIREGLLPEPERPSRNVAWYDESFVERIALIKDLQRRSYLPLRMIKAILDSNDPPTAEQVESIAALDGRLSARATAGLPSPETIAAVARRTGVDADEIDELIRVGAARIETRPAVTGTGGAKAAKPDERLLTGTGVRTVEIWGELRAAGFSAELGFKPQNFALYVDFVTMLVREELRTFSQGVAGRADADTSTRMGEQGIEKIGELLALLRRETMLAAIADYGLPLPNDRTGSD